MSSPFTAPPTAARSWRDLPQPIIKPPAMSGAGKRRLAFAVGRAVALTLFVGLAGWAVFRVGAAWESHPAQLVVPADTAPLRELSVRSDGVLGRDWVAATLALPEKAGLMELDLPALQRRLLQSGQVSAAMLTRRFPDTLVIVLHERQPVARILAQDDNGAPETLLAARDGTVFAGSGYVPELLNSLPFLDGVRLVRAGNGFVPIDGLEPLAVLLETARSEMPDLAEGFHVVSLARYGTDRVIVVKSAEVSEIIFGLREDFYHQLAQLDLILGRTRQAPTAATLRTVNLAVGGNQVPVAFDPPAPAGAAAQRPAPRLAVPPDTAGPDRVFFPTSNLSHQRDI